MRLSRRSSYSRSPLGWERGRPARAPSRELEPIMKTHIGFNGACGRMGQRLVALAKDDPALSVVAALDAAGHPQLGKDAGEIAGVGPIGVKVSADLPLHARVD